MYIFISKCLFLMRKKGCICFMCIKGVYIYIYTCNQRSFVVLS